MVELVNFILWIEGGDDGIISGGELVLFIVRVVARVCKLDLFVDDG